MEHMDQELLRHDMVTGYRTYVEPADLDVGATTEAPATTLPCAASFIASVFSGFQVGNNLAKGWGYANSPAGPAQAYPVSGGLSS